MIVREGNKSVSPFFFMAFVVSCIFIGYTFVHNRDISQRRLKYPIQTEGALESSHCTTFVRGGSYGGQQPYVVLEYKYLTVGPNPTQHAFVTTQWFDTLNDCEAFEKLNSNVATIWYERDHPEKASLYKTESYTWGGLYGLILAAFFVLGGIYDQKSINKAKSKAQKEKRAINRLNRERHS